MSTRYKCREFAMFDTSECAELEQICLAGTAVFTIRSLKTCKKVPFLIKYIDGTFYVHTAVHSHWCCIGHITDNGSIYRWIGRPPSNKSDVRYIFKWFWNSLTTFTTKARKLRMVRVTLSNRCARCGKLLTSPESLHRGFGPSCYQKFLW